MKKITEKFNIVSNKPLNHDVFELKLSGNMPKVYSGQFVNVQLDTKYLRRPFGVVDYSDSGMTLIYKVVGDGTEILSKMQSGVLDIMLPLGTGFDKNVNGDLVLISGGLGLAPLYCLAKELVADNRKVKAVMGFNTLADVIYESEFKALGIETIVVTADGSYGKKGFPTDYADKDSYGFVCGPRPMLDAYLNSGRKGQLSYEARMGCGFGICMGCTLQTKYGPQRICVNGPVFSTDDLIADN